MSRAGSSRSIAIYGAGGHGKVVADIVALMGGGPIVGFLDDDPQAAGGQILGLPVLGDFAWLEREATAGAIAVALGLGNNRVRSAIAERCSQLGIPLLVAVHPRAVIAASARLADGVVVMAGAIVNPCARVGRGAIVNTGAIVEHDVEVGAWAHLSPNATTGGGSRVGAYSHLGLGAVLLPGMSVGEHAIVGAGAVVIRDVPPGATVAGVPARHLSSKKA